MKMFQVKVLNNKYQETVTVTGDKTLREVFEEADINYEDGLINFNGSTIRPNELDKAIEEFNVSADKVQLLSAVRKETQNATAVVNGNVLVVTSALTDEEFDLIKMYAKETMQVKEDDKPKYCISYKANDEKGSMEEFGAIFGRVNSTGHPTITIDITKGTEDVKAFVKPYAARLMYVNAIEEAMRAKIGEAREMDTRIQNSITFM